MLLLALAEGVLLFGGTVHPMTPDAEPLRADVWIERRKIRAVGLDLEVGADVRRIDVTGLHLVPGLVDGMVHHDPDHDPLYVASGVTLVRDAGNDLSRLLTSRRRVARDAGPGPDIFIAGPVLDGSPPVTTEAAVMADADEVDAKLPRLLDAGVDYLSFHLGLPEPAWLRVLAAAHDADVEVWGPVPRGLDLSRCLAEGQDGIFGLDGFLTSLWATGDDREARARLTAELAGGAARAGLAVTPVLVVSERFLEDPGTQPLDLELLGPHYVASWTAELDGRRVWLRDEHAVAWGRALYAERAELLATLHAAGVRLVPGSGSPNPWLLPGRALVDELLTWTAAGIPPADVLRAATAGAAEALGVADVRGTIEADRIADLVVLASDPRVDLATLHRPELVVVRGRVLDRAALDALTETVRRTQGARRAAAAKPIEVAAPELPEGEVLLSGEVQTRALGTAVSAERWAVVREPDGTLAYVGRVHTPGSATVSETELVIEQRIREHRLEDYRVEVRSGAYEIVVQGRRTGSRHTVDQRVNGQFQGGTRTSALLTLVDAGSVTTALILAHHRVPGELHALFFEGFQPGVAPWTLEVGDDGVRSVRTHDGWMSVTCDDLGAPAAVLRRAGSGATETTSEHVDAHGGAGIAPR